MRRSQMNSPEWAVGSGQHGKLEEHKDASPRAGASRPQTKFEWKAPGTKTQAPAWIQEHNMGVGETKVHLCGREGSSNEASLASKRAPMALERQKTILAHLT